MTKAANTRVSLLLRLRDAADGEAWSQFTDIYGPLVYSFGRRRGMQETDAADLVQEVMIEVAKSIGRFKYDPRVGRFRSWLYKIASRTAGRIYKRQQRQPKGAGDTATLSVLQQIADDSAQLEQYWNEQYQRHVFQWAADSIRNQFQDSTWQAFWRTAVDGTVPVEVAKALGMSVGAVYVAKARVLKQLTAKVQEIDDSE